MFIVPHWKFKTKFTVQKWTCTFLTFFWTILCSLWNIETLEPGASLPSEQEEEQSSANQKVGWFDPGIPPDHMSKCPWARHRTPPRCPRCVYCSVSKGNAPCSLYRCIKMAVWVCVIVFLCKSVLNVNYTRKALYTVDIVHLPFI